MKFARLIGTIGVAVAVSAQQAPGMAASVSLAGAQYALNQAIPLVISEFGSFQIPDQSGEQDSLSWTLTNLKCDSFTIGSGTVLMAPSTGIGLTLGGIGIHCSGSWSAKEVNWPHPQTSGDVTVQMSGTSMTLTLDVTDSGNGHPVVAGNNAQISFGSFQINFSGSIIAWLLNLLHGLISKLVSNAIESQLPGIVNGVITNNLNPLLADIALELPLALPAPFNISEVRYGMTSSPAYTSSYAGAGLQGDIVPIANPVTPPINTSAIPPFDAAAASSYVQVLLSSYTFETAIYTYYEAGLLVFEIPSSQVPGGLNNTANYGPIAPFMNSKYPNDPVGIQLGVSAMPQFDIQPNNISIIVPVDFTFNITANTSSQIQAFVMNADARLSMDLAIGLNSLHQTALLPDLTYLGATLSLVSTNVGHVDIGLLQDLVNIVFTDIAMPLANKLLANGIPLPSSASLNLTNTQLLVEAGFVTAASDFVLA